MVVKPSQDPETVARIYRSLRLIRRTEEEIARVYLSDKIKSPVHLSIGQESVAVGVCDALGDDDVVSATYRGHAAYIAKGGDLKGMMAELYGKATGCAVGKAGSMHLVDMSRYVLGSSAVVGTNIPLAVGYGLSLKREGAGRAVACFLGDGATEEGVFSESLNFAALHRLPVLFVCENNGYAIHTPIDDRWATRALCERVATYGIPARQVPDGNVFRIREAASQGLEGIRAGEGPRFVECITYRWKEHVGVGEDYDAGYRSREELEPWARNDPVALTGAMMADAQRLFIDEAVEREVAAALDFAENSPWPDPEELFTHVFAD